MAGEQFSATVLEFSAFICKILCEMVSIALPPAASGLEPKASVPVAPASVSVTNRHDDQNAYRTTRSSSSSDFNALRLIENEMFR
jgi:hypothetical protein